MKALLWFVGVVRCFFFVTGVFRQLQEDLSELPLSANEYVVIVEDTPVHVLNTPNKYDGKRAEVLGKSWKQSKFLSVILVVS